MSLLNWAQNILCRTFNEQLPIKKLSLLADAIIYVTCLSDKYQNIIKVSEYRKLKNYIHF